MNGAAQGLSPMKGMANLSFFVSGAEVFAL